MRKILLAIFLVALVSSSALALNKKYMGMILYYIEDTTGVTLWPGDLEIWPDDTAYWYED